MISFNSLIAGRHIMGLSVFCVLLRGWVMGMPRTFDRREFLTGRYLTDRMVPSTGGEKDLGRV